MTHLLGQTSRRDNDPAVLTARLASRNATRLDALENVVVRELPKVMGEQIGHLKRTQDELVETVKALASAVQELQQTVRRLEGRS